MTDMLAFFRHIACFLSIAAFCACSGTLGSEAGNGDGQHGDPMKEVPEGVLRIFADKTVIAADGSEEVTFTVMFGSEDVSNARTTQLFRELNGDKNPKPMSYGVNKFSTVAAGTYSFTAKYYYGGYYYTDNSVEIEAKQFFTGDEKNYKRQYFGTLFTSTHCNTCPLAANGLKKLQEANPGEIIIAAFHANMEAADPMTTVDTYDLKAALRGKDGLPAFYWNMRPESYTGGATFTESFTMEKERYETYCGVAVNSSYDAVSSKLDLEVCITSNVSTVFRYMVILVEDGIPAVGEYAQNGQNDTYIHDNVVRDVLTKISSFGDKINNELPLTVGVEAKAQKSVTLSDSWNAANMRVIAVALSSSDGGHTWSANNVAECKLGESSSDLIPPL